jgi:NADH:ubiquinone oxidoreductase subunit 6 (subunit J)
MIINLYLILSFLLLLSSIFIISINNPIYKILFLILIFFFGSSLFLILDFYFLGLTYFIVYIGAITILFLFIIMMIQLTNHKTNTNISILLMLPLLLLAPLIFYFSAEWPNSLELLDIYNFFINDWFISFISYTDIELMGYLIYLSYPLTLLIISYLLWLILIGILSIII